MNRKTYLIAVIAALVLILVGVNYTVSRREALIAGGRVVLLPLAPVDPRSLMQGDYMALRFGVASDIPRGERGGDAAAADGFAVLTIADDGVGSFKRLHVLGERLAANEALLRFRFRDSQIKIVTNAYFFQEGTGARFEAARFGELRVADDGTALLTGLRDKEKKVIVVAAK